MRPDLPDKRAYRTYRWMVTHTKCRRAELFVSASGEAPPTETEVHYTLLTAHADDMPSVPIAIASMLIHHEGVDIDGRHFSVVVENCAAAGFGGFGDDLEDICYRAPRVHEDAARIAMGDDAATVALAINGRFERLMRIEFRPGIESDWRDLARERGEALVITGSAVYINPTDATDFKLIRDGVPGQVVAGYLLVRS